MPENNGTGMKNNLGPQPFVIASRYLTCLFLRPFALEKGLPIGLLLLLLDVHLLEADLALVALHKLLLACYCLVIIRLFDVQPLQGRTYRPD